MTDSEVIRARGSRVGAVYALVVGPLVVLGGLSGDNAVLGGVIAVAGLGIALYGALVLWRVGAYPSDRGLTLRGPTGRRFIPWADIDRFELAEGWPYRVWVALRSGEAVKTYGLGASGIRHRESMQESRALIEHLDALLRGHSQG